MKARVMPRGRCGEPRIGCVISGPQVNDRRLKSCSRRSCFTSKKLFAGLLHRPLGAAYLPDHSRALGDRLLEGEWWS